MRSTTKNSNQKPSNTKKFSGNKTWIAVAIIFALFSAGTVFAILANITATTSYYVLNSDVPSRSQITPDMLTEVQASKGTEPRNALTLEDVTYSDVYAKVELNAGDILSASNTGDLVPLHQGIPDNYVVASFVADPNSAVAGKIVTGNYIDIYTTSDGGEGGSATTKASLRHVLVMDAQGSANDYEASEDVTAEEGATSEQDSLRQGLPFLYTVALSEEDAAVLANIRDDNPYVVLSNQKSNTEFESKNIRVDKSDVYGDQKVGNSGENTDPTFGEGSAEENSENVAEPTE